MTVLLTADALHGRRATLAASPDLSGIRAGLVADVERVLAQPLYVPEAKALLSRWGAHCHDDGADLDFDPFAPRAHRCTVCGRIWDTEQSHRWWVYWYQLWLAERVWMMALLSGEGGHAGADARATETLAAIVARYASWPNADNVLGPSRPFFSTYLESVWVLQLASAAALLEDLGRLPADLGRDLRARLFRPSSEIIADFDEGRSNRQAWNAAALYALGRVLDDAGLQERAARGPSGILALVENGLADDGLWYEGENYHWFALRGLAWGAEMLRTAGEVDLWRDASPAGRRFRAAFEAPVLTVQPDFTFPARRDSKYGVSLRQRRMAELWELARTRGEERGARNEEPSPLEAVLAKVYDPDFDPPGASWREITEVERAEMPAGVRRERLGWKGFLWALPEPPASDAPWVPATVHLESSGIAVIRRDDGQTCIGLDYGESGGGHGHPDRLQLTLWHKGEPWLVDFGTGAYTSQTLGWYRSTLAHNAPLVDGHSQSPARGSCVAFEEQEEFAWVCALLPENTAYDAAAVQRTVVVAPGYVLDVVQMHAEVSRQLAVPWHGLGRPTPDPRGVTFARDTQPLRLVLGGRQPFSVVIQRAPGPPSGPGGTATDLEFPIVVAEGEQITLVAAVDLGAGLDEVACDEDSYVVRFTDGHVDVHRPADEGWIVERERGDPIVLGGLRAGTEEAPAPAPPPQAQRYVDFAAASAGPMTFGAAAPEEEVAGVVTRVSAPPALDGTTAGFDTSAPLLLDRADQFRRAEDPWTGPTPRARAYLAHDAATLYVAVEVTTDAVSFRAPGTADPEWENENPDIHSDGLQVYVAGAGYYGWLLVPDPDSRDVRASGVRGTDGEPEMVSATWASSPGGYTVTMAVEVPDLLSHELHFDLCVNLMRPDRERRWGQLVWSGAKGMRLYLAGDRPVSEHLPRVRLA
jgi:heparinase II/III-like protein/alginate lyase